MILGNTKKKFEEFKHRGQEKPGREEVENLKKPHVVRKTRLMTMFKVCVCVLVVTLIKFTDYTHSF